MLTHGALALAARVDFLAVVEHRLIPARVRSEWARLKGKGVASLWAFASQDSSHVGNAGVGVVSMKGAPLALPTFATAQFERFFGCGRAVRCMLPLGFGRFKHMVVLYGYQGADTDAEQLALTEQLFDAALGELSVVARGAALLAGWGFQRRTHQKSLSCQKGFRLGSGLTLRKLGLKLLVSASGHRRDFMVECPLAAAAAVLYCRVQPDRWIALHLAVQTLFDCCRSDCRVTQPVQRIPLWPASWLPATDKSRGSKSVEVQRVWEVHDDRLQFISRQDALHLDESLDAGDVSRAWLVWSGAAEAALAFLIGSVVDAFLVGVSFLAGGPLCFGSSNLVVVKFVRHVVMLLMPMMLLMSSCTVMPLLLLCLI